MQRELRGPFAVRVALTASMIVANLVPAVAQNRIVRPLETSERAALRGSVHPLARPESDQGAVPGSMMLYRMVLVFRPSAAQQAGLEALLAEQQNPVSPYYHQWLTPEQYAERFGLSANDAGQVVAWLQSQGFTVEEMARSRTYVALSGTAAQVESVFGTAIHRFTVNGDEHYANVSDPVLPAPLANIALSLRGLNDFQPKARGGVGRPHPQFTSSISGSHFLAPDDFATIYNLKPLYNSGIDGTGQKLAVMGQTDLVLSDIATFRTLSGLPANTPTVVLVPGSADPGVVNGDIGEADLDVEWSGAVARNAGIIYVNSKNGAFDSLFHAVSQNLAPVISISYGDCEANFTPTEISSMVAIAQQANAQGQTIVGPSGDSGAADCDFPPNTTTKVTSATKGLAVDVPAALPFVTGAGGTTFNEGSGTFWSATNNANNASALSYIPEAAWNDTTFEIANGGSLAATGGGVSTLFAKPAWQTGPGVPNDGQRDVPDISFAASFDHDGYLMCSQGSCVNGFRLANNNLTVVGGTSAGAPVFAGIVALINQQTNAPQGNVNPRLYQLAAASTDAFHDVTSGDNKVPCTTGTKDCPNGGTIGFSAGPGYDTVTGLGSVDAFNLVTQWSVFKMSLSATVLSLTAGATGNVGTVTVTVVPSNGFNGAVALSCSVANSLPGTTCSVSPGSVTTSGSATVTVAAPTTRASLHAPRALPRFFPWTDGTFALAMGLMIVGNDGGSLKKKLRLAVLATLLVTALAMMAGCGGGGGSSASAIPSSTTTTTTARTGAVTIQAIGGGTVEAATISVTVN